MARNRTPSLVVFPFLAALVVAGCLDGPLTQTQGDRGYPCYQHEECVAPLLCLSVTDIEFPVCTGSELQGEPCDDDRACAWLRDDQGLPLYCVDAVCAFPTQKVTR